MIVNIAIHVPDLDPNTPLAWDTTDRIEKELTPALQRLTGFGRYGNWNWWIDVKDGETRYKPENVSELS